MFSHKEGLRSHTGNAVTARSDSPRAALGFLEGSAWGFSFLFPLLLCSFRERLSKIPAASGTFLVGQSSLKSSFGLQRVPEQPGTAVPGEQERSGSGRARNAAWAFSRGDSPSFLCLFPVSGKSQGSTSGFSLELAARLDLIQPSLWHSWRSRAALDSNPSLPWIPGNSAALEL